MTYRSLFSETSRPFLLLWASFFCDSFLCFALHAMGLRFLLSLFIICDVNGVAAKSSSLGHGGFGNRVCIKKRILFSSRVYMHRFRVCVFLRCSFQPACYEFLGFYALYYTVPCMIVT
ncbi:hypothetical protein ASPBRDRAFT_506854 [Aspergillus brasiliensis CBS 101740]|uniref:Uncharacterized protein n=1 Tax=Aspergillus brasiliensis (strain CBS 101740 / IMI 381727 / IBT 21946) TaxID=767769 RepID=A0A1L9UPA7_ASPBC|nr:hypothetical protein ASPBRDRAFT_506854 [Aspergillus brasiliensis CBS 101740]